MIQVKSIENHANNLIVYLAANTTVNDINNNNNNLRLYWVKSSWLEKKKTHCLFHRL